MSINTDPINWATNNLKWAPAKVVESITQLVELKENKSPWEVIEEIVRVWQETCPKTYESFVYDIEMTKRNSKVTKGIRGISLDKETGGYLRHRLDIPVKVVYMIRRLYPDMPMDKEFYKKWAKTFPKMVIESKV